MPRETVTDNLDSDEPVTVKRPNSDPDFSARLRTALGGRSGSWLAEKIGLKAQSVNAWLRAESGPSLVNARDAAQALGVSVQWLATGECGPDEGKPSKSDAPDFGDDFALIPRYEVNLSAGHGLLPDHEHGEERLAFSRVWLRRNGVNPDHAGLVRVRGDSMAPTLPDGALALVHTAEAHVDREGVYAFSRDGEAFVKRLVPVAIGPGGAPTSIVIISDGGAIAPEMVTGLALNELRVVGRVRCILVNM
ncbi:MAG: helix-turn-helix transcriptional regulator [Roseinatronobacter sp.]|nr:MAG: helix-turn-helix transcriptional regulator [Roseinatronobacter sp.]